MINKCRIKIVQKELYNVRDPPWIGDQKKKRRKHCSNLNCIYNYFQLIYTITYLLKLGREWIYLDQFFLLLFDYLSNLLYPLSNSLGPSFPIHSLQIYCAGLTGPISLYILGLGFKNVSLHIYIHATCHISMHSTCQFLKFTYIYTHVQPAKYHCT